LVNYQSYFLDAFCWGRVRLQEIQDGKTVPVMPALAELQQRLEQELGE
jgi:hypothetical protein